MSVSRLYVCVIERGGGFPSLSRCVYVVWVGGRERGRRVWLYSGTPGIVVVSITVSNLSVILHPNKKNLTRFEIATSQILMLTHSHELSMEFLISDKIESDIERDSTLIPGFSVHMYVRTHFVTISKKRFNTTQTQEECVWFWVTVCVCVCVWLLKKWATTERVSLWTGSIDQTVVFIFGKHQIKWLCSGPGSPGTVSPFQEHLHQPPPTKSVHVDFKMHATGICLQEHSTTCAAQDAWFFGLLCAFFATLLPTGTTSNHTWSHKSWKNFDRLRSPLQQGECASFNTRLYGKHGDQRAHLLNASVYRLTFLWSEDTHRVVYGDKNKGLGFTTDERVWM